jgi:uncharacterized membrane protein YbaN (DUF454 family)
MCFFLIRVSPALHARALAWPVVGGPLRDWHNQGGVRPGVKGLAITTVTSLVGLTLLLGSLSFAVKIVIFCAAICGVWVVIRLPAAGGHRE